MPDDTSSDDGETDERLVAEGTGREGPSDAGEGPVGERSWLDVAGCWSDQVPTDVEGVVERRRDQTCRRRLEVVAALDAALGSDTVLDTDAGTESAQFE